MIADTAGYIYALTNSCLEKDVFKIGKTKNSPLKRAKQISSDTGVPVPFEVVLSIRVDDRHKTERRIKNELKHCRINTRKEFYKSSLEQLIELFARYEPKWAKREEITIELPSWIVAHIKEDEISKAHFEMIIESLFINKYGWTP